MIAIVSEQNVVEDPIYYRSPHIDNLKDLIQRKLCISKELVFVDETIHTSHRLSCGFSDRGSLQGSYQFDDKVYVT